MLIADSFYLCRPDMTKLAVVHDELAGFFIPPRFPIMRGTLSVWWSEIATDNTHNDPPLKQIGCLLTKYYRHPAHNYVCRRMMARYLPGWYRAIMSVAYIGLTRLQVSCSSYTIVLKNDSIFYF